MSVFVCCSQTVCNETDWTCVPKNVRLAFKHQLTFEFQRCKHANTSGRITRLSVSAPNYQILFLIYRTDSTVEVPLYVVQMCPVGFLSPKINQFEARFLLYHCLLLRNLPPSYISRCIFKLICLWWVRTQKRGHRNVPWKRQKRSSALCLTQYVCMSTCPNPQTARVTEMNF